MTDDDAIEFLQRIDEAGGIRTKDRSWDETYAGDVAFVTPCGHTVVVFNDCDEWDYIDSIEAPDGSVAWSWDPNVTDQSAEQRAVIDWAPKDESTWTGAPKIEKHMRKGKP